MIVIGIVALPEGGGGRGGGSGPLELPGPRRRRRFTPTTGSGSPACGTTGRERNGRSVPEEVLMAMIVEGETTCPLCGRVLENGQDVIGFPAFLPAGHQLARLFSDAAFHRACFEADSRAEQVSDLHSRYRRVWEERPRKLKTLAEVDAWQRAAFGKLWAGRA